LLPRYCVAFGALLAAIAVGLGAMGAHVLRERLLPQWYPDPERAAAMLLTWETGIRYQMFAAIGVVLIGVWASAADRRPMFAPGLLLLGMLLFSGMLYGWVLTELKALVMIVPLGGLAMIAGWLVFAWQALGVKREA
jgi:uncharacterized membrane protein YgdD (TMEM256/DUF423 family)